ncbi:hypothetical protein MWJ95_12075 [Lysinibacillus sp. Bpr_S20]|nr:hypothetical protein [Lysinibacillus sp. Bpr_S20]
MFSVAKVKRQQQMFYLCESEATATNVFCSESKSVSYKAASWNEINRLLDPLLHKIQLIVEVANFFRKQEIFMKIAVTAPHSLT